jgi:hypothetical protein
MWRLHNLFLFILSPFLFSLKTEEIWASETLLRINQTTRRHIPQDTNVFLTALDCDTLVVLKALSRRMTLQSRSLLTFWRSCLPPSSGLNVKQRTRSYQQGYLRKITAVRSSRYVPGHVSTRCSFEVLSTSASLHDGVCQELYRDVRFTVDAFWVCLSTLTFR